MRTKRFCDTVCVTVCTEMDAGLAPAWLNMK